MKTLSIKSIRIDGETQSRIAINEETVSDYAQTIEKAETWPFPNLTVFHDGSDYWLSSGFHRLLAAKRAKMKNVPCEIESGSAGDARIFGMTANDKNGQRLTRADRQENVRWLLKNRFHLTQLEIAEAAGVSERTVRSIKQELEQPKKPKTSSSKGKKKTDETSSKEESSDERTQSGETTEQTTDKNRQLAGSDGDSGKPGEEKEFRLQRSKTVKTIEALMRALDELNGMSPQPREHGTSIAQCKILLKTAMDWNDPA